MPKGKRATMKEGHPTLSLCGKSGVTLLRKAYAFWSLTVELQSG